jgi:lysophospholipase L1-like esterase
MRDTGLSFSTQEPAVATQSSSCKNSGHNIRPSILADTESGLFCLSSGGADIRVKPDSQRLGRSVKPLKMLSLLVQALSCVCAALICGWIGMPWWSTAATAWLFATVMVLELKGGASPHLDVLCGFSTVIASMIGLGYLLLGPHAYADSYTILAELVAVVILSGAYYADSHLRKRGLLVTGIVWALAGNFVWMAYNLQQNDHFGFQISLIPGLAFLLVGWRIRTDWMRATAIFWAFFTNLFWLSFCHLTNERFEFYLGLLAAFCLAMTTKIWFRNRSWAILGINTIILLIVGLPVTNLFVSPADILDTSPPLAERPFSYEFFKNDPAAYTRWNNYLTIEARRFYGSIIEYEGSHFRLKPNSQGTLCDSRVSINSLGFRGKEISKPGGNAYRVVALGESTTFGVTYFENQKPWPELLEQMLNERLQSQRPIEVINAGTPAFIITENLARLPAQILPLKPDMIVSYHGINGFPLINTALPPIRTSMPPPKYVRRPLKLFADVEYRLKMIRYKKRLHQSTNTESAASPDPMNSDFAEAYRQLIRVCRTNGIRLVLCTYSMAVNRTSDQDIIEFYQMSVPSVPWQLEANAVHTKIVRALTGSNADVMLVDTQAGLDGVHACFTDLVHFAPEGDQRMAETIFAGIRRIVEEDLSRPVSDQP